MNVPASIPQGPRGVAILGATGSIGESTLDVLARHPDRFQPVVLTANTRVESLFKQCQRFRPHAAVMADAQSAHELQQKTRKANLDIEVSTGLQGLCRAVSDEKVDIVMAAIVGAAGLAPTLAAVQAGKRVLIANKEPLVMCGDIFLAEARRSGALLLPIDSEHNAIFQCLPTGYRAGTQIPDIRRVLLTCSGGPFRQRPADKMESITPEEACAHPNWKMGRKISVDSATLMNKGLELIEARSLFALRTDQLEIVIHPQSVIHSMVEYSDGSVLAQLSNPDMRIPIANALAWPERIESGVDPLDLITIGQLEFERPDENRFPCLRLAREAAESGGNAPAILNAANEVAVQSFLDQHIHFTEIPRVIEQVIDVIDIGAADDIDSIMASDNQARTLAQEIINRPSSRISGCLS